MSAKTRNPFDSLACQYVNRLEKVPQVHCTSALLHSTLLCPRPFLAKLATCTECVGMIHSIGLWAKLATCIPTHPCRWGAIKMSPALGRRIPIYVTVLVCVVLVPVVQAVVSCPVSDPRWWERLTATSNLTDSSTPPPPCLHVSMYFGACTECVYVCFPVFCFLHGVR